MVRTYYDVCFKYKNPVFISNITYKSLEDALKDFDNSSPNIDGLEISIIKRVITTEIISKKEKYNA